MATLLQSETDTMAAFAPHRPDLIRQIAERLCEFANGGTCQCIGRGGALCETSRSAAEEILDLVRMDA